MRIALGGSPVENSLADLHIRIDSHTLLWEITPNTKVISFTYPPLPLPGPDFLPLTSTCEYAANEHLRITGILESGFMASGNKRDTTNVAVKERRLVRPGDYISVVNGVSGHTLLLRNEIRARSVTWFHITIVRMCRRPAAVALGGPAPAEVVHVPAPVPPQPKAVGVVAHAGLVLDHFESRALKRPRVEQSDSIPSSMASSAPLCHPGLMSQSLCDSIQEHSLSALDLCPLRLNDSLEHIVLQYFSGSSDGQTT
jgi:hypothetical protein